MSADLPQGASAAGNRAPVVDPIRVMVVDPEMPSRLALARAIDRDPDFAVVGLSRDLRRVSVEASSALPDLIAVRLDLQDRRCRQLLAVLADIPSCPRVAVLGAPGDPAEAATEAASILARLRVVFQAETGGGSPAGAAQAPAGYRLN